jgi:hypothetical protein
MLLFNALVWPMGIRMKGECNARTAYDEESREGVCLTGHLYGRGFVYAPR